MSMEKGTRTRLTTVFILFLVLATGSVLGVAVDRRLEARALASEIGDPGPEARRSGEEGADSEEGAAPRRRRIIVDEVGLTENQKTQVDSIVAHYRQRMRDLQEEVQTEIQAAYAPRYRDLVAETRAEIMGVLDASQRTAYDSLLAAHDRRREERRARDSMPDSGGQGRN